jgi:hypothetical protein
MMSEDGRAIAAATLTGVVMRELRVSSLGGRKTLEDVLKMYRQIIDQLEERPEPGPAGLGMQTPQGGDHHAFDRRELE